MRGRACKELWSARVQRARRWCDGGSGGGIGVVRQHERNSESIGAALLWPSDPAPRSPRVIHSSAPHARQQGRRLLPRFSLRARLRGAPVIAPLASTRSRPRRKAPRKPYYATKHPTDKNAKGETAGLHRQYFSKKSPSRRADASGLHLLGSPLSVT